MLWVFREKPHQARFPWAQAAHMNRKKQQEEHVLQPREGCGTGRDLLALGPRSHQQSPTSCYEVSTVHSRVHHTGRDSQSVPQLPPGEEETTQLAFQDFTMVHSKSRKGFFKICYKPKRISWKCKICKQWHIKE